MKQLKCETCGSPLVLSEDGLHAHCDVCGNVYEYRSPKEEYWIEQLNEANDLRLHNDFDDAIKKYRMITKGNPDDAEAHWGLLLSKYGVAYEVDSFTDEYIPTFHRNKKSNIVEDESAVKALAAASDTQRGIYESALKELRRIQEGIEKVASKCEPYDVFISFKATDEHGNNTIDRDIAYNIYDELHSKDIKTFFSEVSLMDMAAQDYEAVIFNALNTCKVFILVGTSKDNVNATWVKNEWTRFKEIVADDMRNGVAAPQHFAVIGGNMKLADMPTIFAKTQNIMLSKYAGDSYKKDVALSVGKILGIDDASNVTSSEKKQIAKLYTMAEKLLANGDKAKAREYYVEATKLDPDSTESWLRLHCIDNGYSVDQPLAFFTKCTTLDAYKKHMKSNENKLEKLNDEKLLAFKNSGDDRIAQRIDKFIASSRENYTKCTELLNKSLYDLGVSEVNAQHYNEAVAIMQEYINAVEDADAYAYLVIAYGSQGKSPDDPLEIVNATGARGLSSNAFIKNILGSEAYETAIARAEADQKHALIEKRKTVLDAYKKQFKNVEGGLYKDALKLFNETAYSAAERKFKYLLDEVDATNPDYNRYYYLSCCGVRSYQDIISSITEPNTYSQYIEKPAFDRLIKAGGVLKEEAEKLKADIIAKNKMIVDKLYAKLKRDTERAFRSGNYAVAKEGYEKLRMADTLNAEYQEKWIFCTYGVKNREELFKLVSRNIKYARDLAKNQVYKLFLDNKTVDEPLKKFYMESLDNAKMEAENLKVEMEEKLAIYTTRCEKKAKIAYSPLLAYPIMTISTLAFLGLVVFPIIALAYLQMENSLFIEGEVIIALIGIVPFMLKYIYDVTYIRLIKKVSYISLQLDDISGKIELVKMPSAEVNKMLKDLNEQNDRHSYSPLKHTGCIPHSIKDILMLLGVFLASFIIPGIGFIAYVFSYMYSFVQGELVG